MHEIFAVLISILALCLSIYSVWQPHRTKRKKLVNAAYYHVKLAVERLQDMDQQIETAREKIRADKSYKMHIARSNTDDLTYDHVIELMEWLNPDQEKIISDYFHAQSAMHGVAESFDLPQPAHFPRTSNCACWIFSRLSAGKPANTRAPPKNFWSG